MPTSPVVKDLVLIGGGHSHVEVIKRFAMRPQPGVRLTVISREVHTPYSGMLPGLIAGHYAFDDVHIDLGPLARAANARLYHDEVVALDLGARRILCRQRPSVAYDVVSIDTGSAPDVSIPGAGEFAIPVKPVSSFNERWQTARARIVASDAPQRIAVVGGGAGGIELLLSIRHRLLQDMRGAGKDPNTLSFHLVAASEDLLPTHNSGARAKFHRLLTNLRISTYLGRRVTAVGENALTTTQGTLEFDETFWVTTASAPAWPRASGLAVDDNGFILVHPTLQSISHPAVFAAGDIAAVEQYPRPKSGVFAVRQGPPLSANLRSAVLGQRLHAFRPQQEFLSLISTGERHAIGSRGRWSLEGRWLWRLKDWIDRRFMEKYRDLRTMQPELGTDPGEPLAAELGAVLTDPMRCAGCGSKVGADILRDALSELDVPAHDDVLIGLAQPDDAAVVIPRADTVLVQTVDSFRAFIDDPYVFGQIAANHCLSDIFAMGATPQSALALVTLPLAGPAKMREDLVQLMSGALAVFRESGTALVGGHTNEGSELILGFAVNGYIARDRLNRKTGARPGDRLILTKPIGSGILLAAAMRGMAKTRDIETVLEAMKQSNGPAADCLGEHGATALTDVTGFGLFGHLLEMLRAAEVSAMVTLAALPVFAGAEAAAAAGIRSSLHPSNALAEAAIEAAAAIRESPRYALGFDPQTSGGLIASVPPDHAEACIAALRETGCRGTLIGTVARAEPGALPLRIEP